MDATSTFFETMEHQHHLPLLEKLDGAIRFDITSGKTAEHLRITFNHGDIEAAQETSEADCVFRADRALFNDILLGEQNVMAAFLRGDVQVEGDPHYVMSIQRLLPSPPNSRDPKRGAEERTSR